ncbi:MAG TPA: VCBS repeat-containing protein, partial [Polyangiales bacterium]|nr:VCBS repeat-containing protein [Polyangiales bacterium]
MKGLHFTTFALLLTLSCDSAPQAEDGGRTAHEPDSGPKANVLSGGGAHAHHAKSDGGSVSGSDAGEADGGSTSVPRPPKGGMSGGAASGSGGLPGGGATDADTGVSSPHTGCSSLCEGGACIDPTMCDVAACTGVIGLPARPAFTVGASVRELLVADLNGDGRADLATVNTVDKTVSVLLNSNNRTFAPPRQYALGDVLNPDQLIAADLTGDARPELISPDGIVFTNQGDGTFAEAIQAFDGPVAALVAADLDSDGRIDLALAGDRSRQVTVLLNQGNGQYAGNDYPTEEAPLRIVSADFNRDNKPDIATLSADALRVHLLLNNGDGSLSQPHVYETGLTYTATTNGVSWQLVVSDFDGDGATDIVAADGLQTQLSLLANRGDGTFTEARISDLALTPKALK